MPGDANPFRAVLVLTFLSGCAGLAHELLWTRRMVDLLGASAASSTRVFGCFFLGLALGAAAAPSLLRRAHRLWYMAACAEFGVAILSLPALFLPSWSSWIWPALGSARLMGWEGSAVKLLLSSVLVVPPAFCMGLVLPLMARAVLRERYEIGRHGVWLYAANTLGGVVGLILVSFVTLYLVGANGSMWLAIALNVLVGIGCVVLNATDRSAALSVAKESTTSVVDRRVFGAALAAAFISGFGILSFEVLAVQLVAVAAPLSFYAPMSVLAVVVLALGLAAATFPLLAPAVRHSQQLVWAGMLGSSVCLAAIPFWFPVLTQWVALGARDTLAGYLATLLVVVFLGLGPSVLFAGLVFPGVLAWMGTAGGDRYGRHWGWLLAINGLGGLLGAELTYRAIMPTLGIQGSLNAVAILYACTALTWSLWRAPQRAALLATSLGVSLAIVGLTLSPFANPRHPMHHEAVVLDEQIGREGSVAVIDSPSLGLRIMMSNQYSLGATEQRYDQARMAHVPLMLHPQPRQIAFIGLATGITAGAALEHGSVESISAIELSPLVVRAADKFFGPFNHNITRDPRATVVQEDGRTFLAASPAKFDVIVGDLFLPWAPGEGRLYSLEHFRGVRAALRQGGLFCQWLAMYQLTPQQYDLIRDTFCRVFPHAYVFRNSFDCRFPSLALVGYHDGELDWSTISTRCQSLHETNMVLDPVVRHAEGMAMLYLGRSAGFSNSGADINTLSNMRIELDACRERVTRPTDMKYLSGEKWLQFVYERCLKQFASQRIGRSDQVELAWMGQRLALWEAMRSYTGPLSAEDRRHLPEVRAEIQRNFPAAIRADEQADWSQWPGDASLIRETAENVRPRG